MSVEPVAAKQTASPSSEPVSRTQLGKMEFMQILVTQLRYQDPMKPMEDKEFVAQLAQFSALEAMTEQTRWSKLTYGLGLIGQRVTYQQEDGGTATGVVQALRTKDGRPVLFLGDASISVDQVIEATNP